MAKAWGVVLAGVARVTDLPWSPREGEVAQGAPGGPSYWGRQAGALWKEVGAGLGRVGQDRGDRDGQGVGGVLSEACRAGQGRAGRP